MKRILLVTVILSLALPVHGSNVVGGTGMGGVRLSVPGAGGGPTGSYVTIAVFPDNQYQSLQCATSSALERCAEWDATLDWIRDNAATENIEAVLFVGDLIDAGTVLPPDISGGTVSACDAENRYPSGTWTIPIGSESICRAHDSTSVATCEAETGCMWYAGGPNHCLSCARNEVAKNQWDAFDTRAARIATGDISIPWAATKGNHDNAGEEFATDADREPEGWDQRYSSTYWEGIDNGTTYDYLSAETYSDAEGDGHAWIMTVGTQEFLVVAPPYVSNLTISSAAMTWANDVMTNHPTIPAILLAHWIGDSDVVTTIDGSETIAPNLFWAVGGHTGVPSVGTTTNGQEVVLETVSDYTSVGYNDNFGVSQNDYVLLFRWYESSGEVEVVHLSVEGGESTDATAGHSLAQTTFDIMPPILAADAPYDLSAYADEITSVFADTIPPRWPIPPTLTSGPTAVTDCSSLSTSLAVSGRRTTVGAGVTIGGTGGAHCGSISIASDSWLEMDSTAVVYANLTGGNSDRVKITGGTVHQTSAYTMDGDDLLVQNGVWTQTSDTTSFQNSSSLDSGIGSRRAFVNNTITGGSYAVYIAPRPGPLINYDTILVGNEFDGGTTRDESTIRLMNTQRSIFAGNWATNSTGNKAVLRYYDYTYDAMVVGNVIVNGDTFHYEAASVPTHPGDMDNILMSNNRAFREGSQTASTYAAYNSAGGGYTCTNVGGTGNELISTAGSAYTQQSCGGTFAGTASDLDLTPYFGTIPTCASSGDAIFGCGADH